MVKALINGLHADATSSVGWSLTTGVEPYFGTFEMNAGEAETILQEQFVTLQIVDEKQGEFKSLYVVGEAPSSAPYNRTVLLADIRWLWSRAHVLGRYNIRRRSGRKTLLSEDGPVEIAQIVDDFIYAPWSLNEGRKWTATEVIEDVMNKLQRKGGFPYILDGEFDALEINDLDIDAPGPEAVQTVLNQLSGVTMYVSREGAVVFIDATKGGERGVIESSGPEVVDQGHASFADFSRSRPSAIRVYFTKEHEVRFDNRTETDSTRSELQDEREMENVVQITDPTLTISGREYDRFSWVPLESVFAPYNSSKEQVGDGTPPDLTHTIIQRAFFEDRLWKMYVPWTGEPQPIWSGRINSIKHNYRMTYQINRRWVDRMYRMTPTRAAILNIATGTRARAWAYSDHCIRLSGRAIAKQMVSSYQRFFHNIVGYSANLTDAKPSPAIVQVYDSEAGILHLDYRVDPYGIVKEIYPSQMDNIPTALIGDDKPRGLNIRSGKSGNIPGLKANHRVAVVLTLVPAAPNDISQLYSIEVSKNDVQDVLGDLGDCKGPVWELRVHPGLITARIAWKDDQASVVERSFGLGEEIKTEEEQRAHDASMRSLTVNLEDLEAVAKATAIKIWAKLTDRYIGTKTVRFHPDITPLGSITSVQNVVTTDGEVYSVIELAEELAERNILALLPEGVRRVVNREVLPPQQQ